MQNTQHKHPNMDKIISGVSRFRREHYTQNKARFEELAAKKQKPIALFITCADSRIDPNLITGTEPGDLFIIRNAGNIVPPHGSPIGGESATIEYAVEVLGIRNIIVCGHSQCGAMGAILDSHNLDELPAVRGWFNNAEATRRIMQQKYPDMTGNDRIVAGTEENVLVQMNNLSTHPCVAARLSSGELRVFGWYYDIGEGRVLQFDQREGQFFDLNGEVQAAAPLPIRSTMRGAAHLV
jgi:carbonic anhydrase